MKKVFTNNQHAQYWHKPITNYSPIVQKVSSMEFQKVSYKPLYAQVRESLLKHITENALVPGTFLPPERALAAMLGVNRLTLKRALDDLKQQGIISQRQGRGTVICDPQNTCPIVGILGNVQETNFISQDYYAGVLEGLDRELVRKHDGILCYRQKSKERPYAELFPGIRLDVLVVAGIGMNERAAIQALGKYRVPTIVLGENFGQEALNVVCADHFGAAKKGLEFLAQQGHERIVCALPEINENMWKVSYMSRKDGYTAGMKRIGQDAHITFYCGSPNEFLSSLPKGQEPTAILILSANTGKELVHEMARKKMLNPERICVAGFEDGDELADLGVPYYAIQVPAVRIGEKAGKRVMQIKRQEISERFEDIIPFTYELKGRAAAS